VGRVKSRGDVPSALYAFKDELDEKIESQLIYYRLQMVDKDGRFTYSPVEKIQLKKQLLRIIPNPAQSFIIIAGPLPIAVEIYNASGIIVLELKGTASSRNINISSLKAGTYWVKVSYNNNSEQYEKLVIL
jgi:hypothetical protein